MNNPRLKVSELFRATQGEGRYAGVPSVFLRTFGCNLRCPSFGLDHNYDMERNPEVEKIIPLVPKMLAEGKKFSDLPLVNSGCDTYAAVYPEFKNFSPFMTVDEIVSKIKTISPRFGTNNHLILTGGEPLLPGWQKVYPALLEKIYDEYVNDYQLLYLTFETNGTQHITKTFADWFEISSIARTHFSVSLKLRASGEPLSKTLDTDALESYLDVAHDLDFKFVVDCKEHIDEIEDLFQYDLTAYRHYPIYLMPEGGTNEAYAKNKINVAKMALERGFRFSPRLQCEISDNNWGT